MTTDTVYKISLQVPTSYLGQVKEALFAAGAGKYQGYDRCCWQTKGTTQFRPLPGSNPFSGEQGKTFEEESWKIEMLCQPDCLPAAVAALRKSHPYEKPAFDVTPVLLFDNEMVVDGEEQHLQSSGDKPLFDDH